ncbi:MAG: hypothetical protein Q9209_000529 [Squamulea sp. 1 TL-2023]
MGDIRAIQRLFSEGRASPYDVNPRGSNALICAATHGYLRMGQFLLQAGADAELTDSCGRKPVELFYERALSGQFNENDHCLVKSMFKYIAVTEGRGFTVLHKIILGLVGRNLEVELAVTTQTINSSDAHGRTAICWATIRDDRPAVDTLLSFGADPNISDYTGSTCLHYVRSVSVCRALLDKQADVHARNRLYSRTALHSFCKRDGPVEIIGQFIDAGLNVDVRDADGETPLLNATFRGFTAAAQNLLERGADPNAFNISCHDTATHIAVSFDRHELLRLLLGGGADYLATNVRGRHVGHVAARVASARTVQILSSFKLMGMNLSLKDIYGKTAADYLSERELVSQSDVGIHAAFAQLEISCGFGISCAGPDRLNKKLMETDNIEAQQGEKQYQPPGAFPEPAGQQDR